MDIIKIIVCAVALIAWIVTAIRACKAKESTSRDIKFLQLLVIALIVVDITV